MPFVGSSGAKFDMAAQSTSPSSSHRIAYFTIALALILSIVTLIRLGSAASAAAAAVSAASAARGASHQQSNFSLAQGA